MNTEISEHAKEAVDEFDSQAWTEERDYQMVQHGINLAVESKDRRIAELEDRVSWLEQQREFQIQETKDRENEIEEIRQSKDREIERLKAENINLINKINDLNGWRRDNLPV